jgi:arylsulfatase
MSCTLDTFNRRDFLRLATASAAALPLACGSAPEPVPEQAAAERPNVILIMADDMGYSDIGCYGGEIATPQLDSLADGGLRFKQFYNGARCCPTRAQLMTGLYAHQTGIGHMMEDYDLPGYRGDLNTACVTIAEVMKSAGYTTLMTGKWHVTPNVDGPGDRHNWPRQRGFDHFFGTIHGAGSFYDPVSLTLENEYVEPEGDNWYYTDAIGDHAIQFIEKSPADAPFFLYMPFTAAHWPLHAPDEEIAKYKGRYDVGWDKLREERYKRMIELGIVKPEWPLSPRDPEAPAWEDAENKEWEARRMEVYAAQVTIMDRNIGRVVEKLKELGRYENTLILFLIDNGGCAEELRKGATAHHIPTQTRDGRPVHGGNDPEDMPGQADDYQSYGLKWANASNTPFRYFKHWVHEGGISTPLIAHWPAGVAAPGTWSDEISHLIDIMATCADLGEATYPTEYNGHAITPLEGKSLGPVLKGSPRESHDAIYWEHEGNRAIRQGKWKLVSKWRPPENNKWELYDIDADRPELKDLAAEMPDKVQEMSAKWQAWADRAGVVEWQSWQKKS